MYCEKCGYALQDLETDCPRCRRQAQRVALPPPPPPPRSKYRRYHDGRRKPPEVAYPAVGTPAGRPRRLGYWIAAGCATLLLAFGGCVALVATLAPNTNVQTEATRQIAHEEADAAEEVPAARPATARSYAPRQPYTREAAPRTEYAPAGRATYTPRPTYTPPPAAPYVPPAIGGGGGTVYGTRTGECYHRDGCGGLRRSRIPMTRAQAEAQGLRPCRNCNP